MRARARGRALISADERAESAMVRVGHAEGRVVTLVSMMEKGGGMELENAYLYMLVGEMCILGRVLANRNENCLIRSCDGVAVYFLHLMSQLVMISI
jgi:hypothetical protein